MSAITAADLRAAKRAALPTELARRRFDAGLTIRDVVRAVGISSTSVLAAWEHGEHQPRGEYLRRLCDFYQATPQELINGRTGRPWRAFIERGGV